MKSIFTAIAIIILVPSILTGAFELSIKTSMGVVVAILFIGTIMTTLKGD